MSEPKIEVKFGEWIQRGFDLYKNNFLVLLAATLLATVIGVVTSGILSGPMFAGVILIALGLLDKKEPRPDIGTVFKGFDYFLNAFLFFLVWGGLALLVSLLMGWAVKIYIAPLLVSAVHLVLRTFLIFGFFLIVDRKMDFWPASLASIKRVKSNFWPLLAFVIIVELIGALGLIACGVGVIITLPITICCLAVAYRAVFAPEAA